MTSRAPRVFNRLALAAAAAGLATAALGDAAFGASPRFYDDDPIWQWPETQDASGARPWEIDLTVDLTVNLFGRPGDPTPNVRAQNLNTVDEVPDSSWFTNRAGHLPLTPDEVAKGPDTGHGPAPGRWTVSSAKSDGITPGFTIRDARGQRWFLKFDPPGYRAMATGTEVAVTKLMWALGYNVPENHIGYLRREQLVIGEGARFSPPGRKARSMRLSDIEALLERADREPDGSYRIIASRALDGTPLGGFRFHGTRPDDPNDTVPHEHRRELRGYGTFAAWLNHVDAKAINSLDTLVKEGGRVLVRHHLLDFGSTLGSGAVYPREPWEGYEYMVQPRDVGRGIVALGFLIAPWRTVDFYEAPSVGRLPRDNTDFDLDAWRPRVANPAFLRARPDDKFWAARKLKALSDEIIRAAIRTGRFDDDESEGFLVKALIERRDAIARKYFTAINPIIDPALDGAGVLTFGNAAVAAGFASEPQGYRARWFVFDNMTATAREIGQTTGSGPRVEAPTGLPGTGFVKVELSATGGGAPPSWAEPVHVYFRHEGASWQLVGFERMPD